MITAVMRHPPRHRLEREPLRWVCGSYLRQSWNVVMAFSLQRVDKKSSMIHLCNAVRKEIFMSWMCMWLSTR
jgi:hypothetical protein